jgi:glutamate racemase
MAFHPSATMVIGVFDSGVGGLTVLKELIRLNPSASYAYFGDTARLPYGSKSAETVARYAVSAAHFLRRRGAEMLVIACNTATALALNEIKQAVDVPVIGVVEPGAEAAARASQARVVTVIATQATVGSHAYHRALAQRGIAAHEKACPLLVPLVEEGWIEHPVTEQVAGIYLKEAFSEGGTQPDVLLLGCTHYPLLRGVLQRLVPPGVSIVDSAQSTAEAVAAHSNHNPSGASGGQAQGTLEFFATDSVEKFCRLGERFLGHPFGNVSHVDIEPETR